MTTDAIEAGARAKSIVTNEMVRAALNASGHAPDVKYNAIWMRRALEAAIASGALVPAAQLAAERERCAKVADKHAASLDNDWNKKLGVANDLREVADDIAAAIRAIEPGPASGEFVVVSRSALSDLLIDDDSDKADDECELCGGRGTVDAYTARTEGRQEGRDEIGCPACIERQHSRMARSAMLNAATKDGTGS